MMDIVGISGVCPEENEEEVYWETQIVRRVSAPVRRGRQPGADKRRKLDPLTPLRTLY
jgi:hypothetical protein